MMEAKHQNREIGSKYWISSSYHESPPTKCFPNVNSFIISIVLDFEARYEFSAIRLLILCQESEDLSPITIVKCKDPNQCGVFAPDGHKRWYRSRLVTRSNVSDNPQPAQVCTVAFELQRLDDGALAIVKTSLEQPPDEEETSLRRTVYEYTQSTEPIEPALLIFLSINRLLQPILIPQNSINMLHIPTHSIRVLPVPTTRRGSHIDLPPDIIRRIVQISVGTKFQGWLPALLNYSLVCKAWGHVLELFFSSFGGRSPVDARHVLRTLRWRPQYGALIRYHDYKDYSREGHLLTGGIAGWDAFCDILKQATLVYHLHLPTIPLQLVDGVVSILRKLHSVGELAVRQTPNGEDDRPLMNMADIQMAIADWPPLKDLRLSGFGEARERDSEYDLPNHLRCGPQQMTLRGGAPLSPGQLLRFVSSTNCQLTNVIFDNITGPTNAEFLSFLSIAAPTLRTIDMHLCRFTCSPGEELALDAVMPQMKSLEFLVTSGSFAGISSVIRKPPPSGLNPCRIWIYFVGLGITIQDVEQAMHVTEWHSITISWRDVPAWDPSLIARAQAAAQNRGIYLTLRQNLTPPD